MATDIGACWWCTSFGGIDPCGSAAVCLAGGRRMIKAEPQRGCSFFSREPGCDDEPSWMPENWHLNPKAPKRRPLVPAAPATRPESVRRSLLETY